MKNLVCNISRILLSALFVAGLTFTFVSCGDDEKVDCSKALVEFANKAEDLYDTELPCNEIDAAGEKYIKAVRNAKSCDFMQEMMEEYQVDNIDDLVEMLEAEIEEMKAICQNPA
ncbi:MAG TPA: hypothetical protein VFM90_03285 [Cyclobacteriaceae bacterium]|nr:hypothetical protein [Cyclobacteriaceae bacterium]